MANGILSKIKDKKLRDMLKAYQTTTINFGLIDIMNYFGITFRVDAIDAILPKYYDDGANKIYLGGIIVSGKLYGVYLEVTDQNVTLRLGEEHFMLVSRENKQKVGDENVN